MFVDHRHRLIVYINPGTGSLALQAWGERLRGRGGVELWNRSPSWNHGRDLTHLDAREIGQVLPETTVRSYRSLSIQREPGERLQACLQEMARSPTGRRWLNEERIHSLGVLAERLLANPWLIHNSNLPWLKPQAWFDVGKARGGQHHAVPYSSGVAGLRSVLANLGYPAEERDQLGWESQPILGTPLDPRVKRRVQEAACQLEAQASPVPQGSWSTPAETSEAQLTLMLVGEEGPATAWQRRAATWGCPLVMGASPATSLEGYLGALAQWLQSSPSEALLLLAAGMEAEAADSWRFHPSELVKALPADWGIVQLAPFWPIAVIEDQGQQRVQWLHAPELHLHRHWPGREWGCDALLVRRPQAEALLNRYGNPNLAATMPGLPLADRLLLDDWSAGSPWRSYTLPLLPPAKPTGHEGLEATMRNLGRAHHEAQAQPSLSALVREPLTGIRDYPFVSIHTVTRNRSRHLAQLQRALLRQTYPASRMEWVIVDASDTDAPTFQPQTGPMATRTQRVDPKIKLGDQRNLANSLCRGQIIVCCDDDDHYFPKRIAHAVESLLASRSTMAAGCTLMPIQFWDRDELWLLGPYTPNHSTANALAFRRTLLEWRRFDPEATLAEENGFLGEFTEPMVQLDPWQSLICMAHDSNTFRKQTLFEKAAPLLHRSPRSLPELMPADLYRHSLALFQPKGIDALNSKTTGR